MDPIPENYVHRWWLFTRIGELQVALEICGTGGSETPPKYDENDTLIFDRAIVVRITPKGVAIEDYRAFLGPLAVHGLDMSKRVNRKKLHLPVKDVSGPYCWVRFDGICLDSDVLRKWVGDMYSEPVEEEVEAHQKGPLGVISRFREN
jgi:hypothetical protein